MTLDVSSLAVLMKKSWKTCLEYKWNILEHKSDQYNNQKKTAAEIAAEPAAGEAAVGGVAVVAVAESFQHQP